MAKAQRREMEIEKHELEVVAKIRCVILDITTLLEKILKF
jgi:hypothetical protein